MLDKNRGTLQRLSEVYVTFALDARIKIGPKHGIFPSLIDELEDYAGRARRLLVIAQEIAGDAQLRMLMHVTALLEESATFSLDTVKLE